MTCRIRVNPSQTLETSLVVTIGKVGANSLAVIRCLMPSPSLAFALDEYAKFIQSHPTFQPEFDQITRDDKMNKIAGRDFQIIKERLILADLWLQGRIDIAEVGRQELIETMLTTDAIRNAMSDAKEKKGKFKASLDTVVGWFTQKALSDEDDISHRARNVLKTTSDADFLTGLDDMLSREPLFQESITQALDIAHSHLQSFVSKTVKVLVGRAGMIQKNDLTLQFKRQVDGHKNERRRQACLALIEAINKDAGLELYAYSSYTFYFSGRYISCSIATSGVSCWSAIWKS